jgi:hypothetical protein
MKLFRRKEEAHAGISEPKVGRSGCGREFSEYMDEKWKIKILL